MATAERVRLRRELGRLDAVCLLIAAIVVPMAGAAIQVGLLGFVEDFICEDVLPFYANTHTESSGTGRQTTQLREEARVDHPRGGRRHPRARGDLHRLRLHRRDRQADADPRPPGALRADRAAPDRGGPPGAGAAGGVRRTLRAPLQRAALARVGRRRGAHPRGLRRPHRPRPAGEGAGRLLRPPAPDRLVLGRLQRHRGDHRHRCDLGAAPPPRRARLLGLRRRGSALRDRHERQPPPPAVVQGRGDLDTTACRSSPSWRPTGAGCTTTSWSRCSTTSSASSRAEGAPAPVPMATA